MEPGHEYVDIRFGANETFKIGRRSDSDLILEYPTVSADHCHIIWYFDGARYYACVFDTSTNGTKIMSYENGQMKVLTCSHDLMFIIEAGDVLVLSKRRSVYVHINSIVMANEDSDASTEVIDGSLNVT